MTLFPWLDALYHLNIRHERNTRPVNYTGENRIFCTSQHPMAGRLTRCQPDLRLYRAMGSERAVVRLEFFGPFDGTELLK